jgi:hypothetical protein
MTIRARAYFVTAELLFAFAASLPAQTVRLPELGVASHRGQLFPVSGVPGAARLTEPLDISGVDQLYAIPASDLALGISSDSKQFLLIRNPRGVASVSSFDFGEVDSFVPSPSGDSVLVKAAGAPAKFHVLSGINNAGTSAWSFELDETGGSIERFAVSDTGQAVLVMVNTDSGDELLSVRQDVGTSVVTRLGAGAAVSFIPRSRDGVAVDAGTQQLLRLDGGAVVGSAVLLTGSIPQAFSAVSVSMDGRRLFAAGPAGDVLMIDVNDGNVERIDCECVPTGLARLNGDVFQLLVPESSNVWLLSLRRDMRLTLVPAYTGGAK